MARVKIQPGGKVLIGLVVLGALLFLFFEFKPAANKPHYNVPPKLPSVSTPVPATEKSEGAGTNPEIVTAKSASPVSRAQSPGAGSGNSPVRIYFAFNVSHVNKNVYCIFDRIQSLVTQRGAGGIHIVVEGNADSIGAPWYNVELSRRRAARVADSLSARLGVPLNEITLVANGSSKPIASNSTAAGRADNRRTDVIIYR